ncbi:hypothetical protein MJO28_008953 [Puccinia striiformis f. sp. tritici]|nr:hypothetical protein Pst134EA_033501 [Puccinia striiformis f. sp. tritici]POV98998.1 hypothetical protein PSTT_14072 [Puccinia striiformis]KAH9452184.1 hypothetical protein Pst134EB_033515 [Puccinia striiformis f. sp. tritici]KAH9462935.1 hypothetical protein Pst134EA_033501 [Puccinia striiformis f. sp. tritici]KAI7950132.1 hypothetical protein MJO28_008953 [Puccinia striiformis f. sp. tritici]KAI7953182.1 hypothetical protein MJO29_008813 [Puccinia striiformis f. sp. tritici]
MNEPLEMDNPTKKKAPTSKRSRKEDHRQQGDLVVEAFNSLIAKCKAEDDDSSATRDGREKYDGLVIDQIDLKSDLLFQLHSSYLPQLRHQITTLSESLKPSDLLKNPHSKFDFISEIQSDLDRTLDQIFSARRVLCPLPIKLPSTRINDYHLKVFKSYRLYSLQYALTSCFLDAIICVFYHFGDLIRQLKLTTQKHDCKADLASVREDILCEVDHSLFMIEEAITWVNGSEFDIVQVGWRNEKREIGESVQELLSMISPANPATKGEKQSERKPLSESATQLAKSVVPVMKLSRLFFDKMSRRGMNQKKLPLYTTMSSHQLNTIDELAQNIEGRLTTILRGLGDADTYHEPDTSELLTEVVQEIEAHFDAGILLILLHFVPIIPDTDGFPVQNYYKDWLATWNTQLSIAVNNHLEACKIFEQNAE